VQIHRNEDTASIPVDCFTHYKIACQRGMGSLHTCFETAIPIRGIEVPFSKCSFFWAPGAAPGLAVASVFFAEKARTRPFASLAQTLH